MDDGEVRRVVDVVHWHAQGWLTAGVIHSTLGVERRLDVSRSKHLDGHAFRRMAGHQLKKASLRGTRQAN